ncbi:MAG TPA: isoprenoid biosynthesis glyoxalase ElbB [Deltaproteobacteria bacterium]|nr:isoprenoid biosynthesis glyoxalase ElbB [Deltaproteobacteria bacterium]
MARKIGVVLSGCGVFDGSEIYEATMTLYFLDRAGADVVCMAPEGDQRDVVDHAANRPMSESRDIFVESARLARGEIRRLADVTADDLDALVFPGGFGAAKNLCDFTVAGSGCTVLPEVEGLILDMHGRKKPLAFMCIAPVIAARVLGRFTPELTTGESDSPVASAIEEMGARHVTCSVDRAVVDGKNRIVTTPAYMVGPTISRVAEGIEQLVKEIMAMVD